MSVYSAESSWGVSGCEKLCLTTQQPVGVGVPYAFAYVPSPWNISWDIFICGNCPCDSAPSRKAWPPAAFLAVTPTSPQGHLSPGGAPGCVSSCIKCGVWTCLAHIDKTLWGVKECQGGVLFLGPVTLLEFPPQSLGYRLADLCTLEQRLAQSFLGTIPHLLQPHVSFYFKTNPILFKVAVSEVGLNLLTSKDIHGIGEVEKYAPNRVSSLSFVVSPLAPVLTWGSWRVV